MPDTFTYTQLTLGDDKQTVSFGYTLTRNGQEHHLTETLRFPVALKDTPAQRASLRALHLALGISYYKIFTPPTMSHPYHMGDAQAAFWNEVWRNGLGEFLYVNKISPDTLALFAAQDGERFPAEPSANGSHKALLGVGGGKDSIVAGELLKKLHVETQGFVLATGEQRGQAQAVADTMGVQLHAIERNIDKQLLELQEQPGAHKGHVPISLIFGLVGAALAVALDAAYVVVANEASASIPRTTWEHGSVNHQWSKSFGLERQLQSYIHDHVSDDVTYFSAIRPLSSVAVAKLFTHYPQYFEVFTSDNSIFRIDPAKRANSRWGLESAKSLSSFILLAPWMAEADLVRAFERNFLDEASLEKLFLELVGVEGEQPLDCVGTVDELLLSLNLANLQGKFKDSALMHVAYTRSVITEADWQAALDQALTPHTKSAFPVELAQPLRNLLAQELTT